MKSTTTFELVLVAFPFSDLSTKKKRPCLVLKSYDVRKLGTYLVVCMVTSQLEGLHFPGDLILTGWREAGLPKPSLVRVSKLVTIEESLVLKRLGQLNVADAKSLRAIWKDFAQVD